MDFDVICRVEVVNHVGAGLIVALIKNIVLWVHVPLDLMDLVGPVRSVFGHNDGSFEFSLNEILVKSLESILD
jgi:hypothetical protein